jgi:hypothetical protein
MRQAMAAGARLDLRPGKMEGTMPHVQRRFLLHSRWTALVPIDGSDGVAAGVLVSSQGLALSSKSKRLVFTNHDLKVIDGPLSEAKQLIGGCAVLELPSIDVAVRECLAEPGEAVLENTSTRSGSRRMLCAKEHACRLSRLLPDRAYSSMSADLVIAG